VKTGRMPQTKQATHAPRHAGEPGQCGRGTAGALCMSLGSFKLSGSLGGNRTRREVN
jgi:hypothetical protein